MLSSLSPSRTVVTSFTPRKPSLPDNSVTPAPAPAAAAFEEGDWVLRTTADTASVTVSCALSNGEVQVYDQSRLHRVHTFQGRNDIGTNTNTAVINDLICGPQHTIVTAGSDSQIIVWDLRQGTAALRTSIPAGQSALSVSVGFDGYLAAVASNKAQIHFMDLRQAPGGGGGGGGRSGTNNSANNVLGSYVDSHTDEVTQVHFQPGTSVLLSGAEDGLACIFDTTQPTEEMALKSVMNVGTPLRHVGFCGASLDSIYCLTGSETASLWHWDSAVCQQDFGGNLLRERLVQPFGNKLAIDYLVDAHWDVQSQELLMMTGSATGDAALFRLTERSPNFEPCHALTNGHRGVVRSWSPLSSSSVLITAGEDARLCEWNRLGPQAEQQAPAGTVSTPSASSSGLDMDMNMNSSTSFSRSLAPTPGGGGPVRPQKRQKQSAHPY
jgi:WD40 repeat protein